MRKKVVSKGKNEQGSSTSRILIVPVLAIAGWLTTILPNVAVAASYSNDYSVCAGRILSLGVTAEAASQGCAKALRPRDLAACVVKIKKQTQIAATDALYSCGKARRPEELATCVVGVSSSTQEAVNPAALDYCGRSLLPVRFGQCVVGFHSSKIDLPPTQILETCIDASDSVIGASSSFTPPSIIPTGSSPSLDITPIQTPQPLAPAQPVVPLQPLIPTQPGTN